MMDAALAMVQQILEYLNKFSAGTIIQVIRDGIAKFLSLFDKKDQ